MISAVLAIALSTSTPGPTAPPMLRALTGTPANATPLVFHGAKDACRYRSQDDVYHCSNLERVGVAYTTRGSKTPHSTSEASLTGGRCLTPGVNISVQAHRAIVFDVASAALVIDGRRIMPKALHDGEAIEPRLIKLQKGERLELQLRDPTTHGRCWSQPHIQVSFDVRVGAAVHTTSLKVSTWPLRRALRVAAEHTPKPRVLKAPEKPVAPAGYAWPVPEVGDGPRLQAAGIGAGVGVGLTGLWAWRVFTREDASLAENALLTGAMGATLIGAGAAVGYFGIREPKHPHEQEFRGHHAALERYEQAKKRFEAAQKRLAAYAALQKRAAEDPEGVKWDARGGALENLSGSAPVRTK